MRGDAVGGGWSGGRAQVGRGLTARPARTRAETERLATTDAMARAVTRRFEWPEPRRARGLGGSIASGNTLCPAIQQQKSDRWRQIRRPPGLIALRRVRCARGRRSVRTVATAAAGAAAALARCRPSEAAGARRRLRSAGRAARRRRRDPHHRHARSGADDGDANAARRPDLTIGTRAREQLEALLSQRRDRSSRARPDGRVVVGARAASAPEGEKDTDAARAATAKALATAHNNEVLRLAALRKGIVPLGGDTALDDDGTCGVRASTTREDLERADRRGVRGRRPRRPGRVAPPLGRRGRVGGADAGRPGRLRQLSRTTSWTRRTRSNSTTTS